MKWKYAILIAISVLVLGFVIFPKNDDLGLALVLLSLVTAPLVKINAWFIPLLKKYGAEGLDQEMIWKKICAPDESVEFAFGIGDDFIKWTRILWLLIAAFLATTLLFTMATFGIIIFAVITAIVWLSTWYIRIANRYAFTNKRVLIHKGWLGTRLISIDYHKITDIRVVEPFFERIIYKTGSIAINTAGTSSLEVVLTHVEKPYEIKKKLEKLRETYSKR